MRISVRALLLVVVVAQLSIATGLLWNHFSAEGSPDGFRQLEVATPGPLTIESAIVAAQPVADEWAADSTLFAATMQLTWDSEGGATQPNGSGWVMLTYRSAKKTFTLLIDRAAGWVIDSNEKEWDESPTRSIATSGLSILSSVAVTGADLGGGSAFRSGCPQYRTVTRVGLTPRGDGLAWVVTYEDSRQLGRPLLEFVVDAISGKVVETNDWSSDGPACDT